jgi:hypothetical protein
VGVVAALLVGGVRDRWLLVRERRRAAELAVEAGRVAAYRVNLRRERQRVRRSHRLKRSAQRVAGMVRTLAGCREREEAARRAAHTMVDGFGARAAAVWVEDEGGRVALLSAAGEESVVSTCLHWGGGESSAPPAMTRVALQDDDGRTVGHLLIEFDQQRPPTAGLSTYAAVLGAVLGACGVQTAADTGDDPGAGAPEVTLVGDEEKRAAGAM